MWISLQSRTYRFSAVYIKLFVKINDFFFNLNCRNRRTFISSIKSQISGNLWTFFFAFQKFYPIEFNRIVYCNFKQINIALRILLFPQNLERIWIFRWNRYQLSLFLFFRNTRSYAYHVPRVHHWHNKTIGFSFTNL